MILGILTLFPEFFAAPLQVGMLGRAVARNILCVDLIQLREYAADARGTVDDLPFGGGPGMVLKPEPIFAAVEDRRREGDAPLVYFSPAGAPLTQEHLRRWADLPRLLFLCGRYEGVDQRVVDHLVDEEVSVGDFILSGGEPAALAAADALARLLPGVLGTHESLAVESFTDDLLEYPHYTRPAEFRGWEVPSVLRSGDHAAVERWRREQAEERTRRRRPDLWRRRLEGGGGEAPDS